jgi:6,7-dimethyl-8-ribityllumazine synthase
MATVNKTYPFMIKTVFKSETFSFWVVVAEWNEAITEGLYNGRTFFLENKVPAEHIRWNVPGSFELIYGCKKFKLKT